MRETDVLVIGGTKGLGRSIAKRSLALGHKTTIVGRSAEESKTDPELAGAECVTVDLTTDQLGGSEHELMAHFFTHVFWVAGIPSIPKPLHEFSRVEFKEFLDPMILTHLRGPLLMFHSIIRLLTGLGPHFNPPGAPTHLITVASTSSYRMRTNETLYCMLKAAKAAFTRQYARELALAIPGSMTTLVNPGGMDTEFLKSVGVDTTGYPKPDYIAGIIWDEMAAQQAASKPFEEVNLLRQPDGTVVRIHGPQTPELPF